MTNDASIRTVGERCTGTTRSGAACTRIALRQTSAGLRCSHHDPDRSAAQGRPERRAPKPPVGALVTPADALALSSWAALMAARDRLSQGQVRSILHACREWRQCLRDAGILEEFEKLKRQVAALTAAKEAL